LQLLDDISQMFAALWQVARKNDDFPQPFVTG
jgi:hypothetical protein